MKLWIFFIRPHYVSFITRLAIISQKRSPAVSINYPGRKCENQIFFFQHVYRLRVVLPAENCTGMSFLVLILHIAVGNTAELKPFL